MGSEVLQDSMAQALFKAGTGAKNEGSSGTGNIYENRSSGLAGLIEQTLPKMVVQDTTIIEQHIREGEFQRSLALITGFSSLLGGLEVAYEHYRGSYSQRIMYTPVILSGLLASVSIWGAFNRKVARTLLPVVAGVMCVDAVVGFFFHIRGIARKPGGWRLPAVNLVMGPPVLAPLLLAISGFLGIVTAFLRREEDLGMDRQTSRQGAGNSSSRVAPWGSGQKSMTNEQDIREGYFQKGMALAAALSVLCSGFEALYSHYKNNYRYKIQWTPILLTPLLFAAGIGTMWSKKIAQTLLPVTSVLAIINGTVGAGFHLRGILRRSGGAKHPIYNVLYGAPILAPLLFAASGFMGLLASLLRRRD